MNKPHTTSNASVSLASIRRPRKGQILNRRLRDLSRMYHKHDLAITRASSLGFEESRY